MDRGRPSALLCRLAATAAVVALVAGALVGCATDRGSSRDAASAPTTLGFAVAADRQPLTTDPSSPVAHDTETLALADQGSRLFAATGQWTYDSPDPAGQILVKDHASSPWRVFEQTQSLRVQALDSFAIPADQGLGAGHHLLITQAVIDGRSEIQWLVDGADSFSPDDAFTLASPQSDVRAFGAHEDRGAWSVYAGTSPQGVLRGTWSPTRHTLVFDPTPELTAAPPGSPGLKTQKVTGFADCGASLYVTINTHLYRRTDGAVSAGAPRWDLVYQEPAVGAFNSGLRGVTCVRHDDQPALLVSTEGTGDVYRFGDLGARSSSALPLAPVLEWSPRPAIAQMLAAHGTTVPATGKGSVGYVIAAYNDFTPIGASGTRQLVGFEWGYVGGCAPNRRCGPTAFKGVAFDAAACFATRSDATDVPAYGIHCLGGPDLDPSGSVTKPIRSGQALVSIRTIASSPFGDGRTWFGGYDCNFYPADGTAWVASSAAPGLRAGPPT